MIYHDLPWFTMIYPYLETLNGGFQQMSPSPTPPARTTPSPALAPLGRAAAPRHFAYRAVSGRKWRGEHLRAITSSIHGGYIPYIKTHTHLLRNIFANSDVERIVRAKNTSIKPDRSGWMIRSENPCEGNHSTSLLDVTVPSELNRDLPLQIATTAQRKLQIASWRHGGSWVEPLPITEKELQVRHGDQPWYPHVL